MSACVRVCMCVCACDEGYVCVGENVPIETKNIASYLFLHFFNVLVNARHMGMHYLFIKKIKWLYARLAILLRAQ